MGAVLDGNESRAVQMVLDGVPRGQIAEELDVDPSTVRRWLHRPHVAAALRASVAEALSVAEAMARVQCASAMGVLVELMSDPNTPTPVRRQAACDVLDRGGLPKVAKQEILRDPSAPDDPSLALATKLLAMTPEQLRAWREAQAPE